jgi:hypothetical protein
MITKLSPQLKLHIEEYIEEIEQNNVHNSIIRCPVDILPEYMEVLQQIDVEPLPIVKPYIDVAICVASKTVGHCHCSNIEFNGSSNHFEFSILSQNIDIGLFQKHLRSACPQYYVQSKITYEYGLPVTVIQIDLLPLNKFQV